MHMFIYIYICTEQDIKCIQHLLETMLYMIAPAKWYMPQFMFAVVCNSKHVPQSIRFSQEMTAQRMPESSVRSKMKTIRFSGSHELHVGKLLKDHGKADKRMCFIRADNYQHLNYKTASASAVDASKVTAHIVFTSAIKTGSLVSSV